MLGKGHDARHAAEDAETDLDFEQSDDQAPAFPHRAKHTEQPTETTEDCAAQTAPQASRAVRPPGLRGATLERGLRAGILHQLDWAQIDCAPSAQDETDLQFGWRPGSASAVERQRKRTPIRSAADFPHFARITQRPGEVLAFGQTRLDRREIAPHL